MHVDGRSPRSLVYWAALRLKDLAAANGAQRSGRFTILRKRRLDPEWSSVERQTYHHLQGHAGCEYQGLDDLYRIYGLPTDGTDFNLAYIPATFTGTERTDF